MIFAGQLTETLSFYHIVEVQSGSGFKKTEEVHYLTCKAHRTKNKESFVVDAEEIFHNSHLSFTLRYRKGIDETDIVVYVDKRYRIISLNKYASNNEIGIMLEKINE